MNDTDLDELREEQFRVQRLSAPRPDHYLALAEEADAAVRVLEALAGATAEQRWNPGAIGTVALRINGVTLDRWREYLGWWQQFAEAQHINLGHRDCMLEVARKFAFRVGMFDAQSAGNCTLEDAAETVIWTAHYCTQPATRTNDPPRFTPTAPRSAPLGCWRLLRARLTVRQPRRTRTRVTRGSPTGSSRADDDDPAPAGLLHVTTGTWRYVRAAYAAILAALRGES